MGEKEIEPDSVRAMLNGNPHEEERAETLKEETERLQWEAKQRRIANELSAVADMKRRYVEPTWRLKTKGS